MNRDDVVGALREVVDGRHVRWRSPGGIHYDGVERTLEVYDVEARDQLALLKGLRAMRADIDRAASGRVVFVFYTPSQSRERRAALAPVLLSAQLPFARTDIAVAENQTLPPRTR